ncbi:MAG: Asp-tRNA(Asn)/Glu-tRNA(Gln) amidotransferase GatCAB subunit B, partial [Methanosarcinales archaeon]
VKKKGLLKADSDQVLKAIEEVIKENPNAVQDYQSGKVEALNFLVGQVMKKTRGRADAKLAREQLQKIAEI